MKITLTTFLLTLAMLGGCREQSPEAGNPEIEKNGWKLVFVWYNEGDTTATAKDSRFYGMPLGAFFAKDYPFEAGKESPKILLAPLEYAEQGSSLIPAQRGILLLEVDCDRRLMRHLRTFKADGSETTPEPAVSQRWDDIPKEAPGISILQYACRPRSSSKP
jgi:hypothetical protein